MQYIYIRDEHILGGRIKAFEPSTLKSLFPTLERFVWGILLPLCYISNEDMVQIRSLKGFFLASLCLYTSVSSSIFSFLIGKKYFLIRHYFKTLH